MVTTKTLKHSYLWFQSVFNRSVCNCCGSAVCIIGKTHEAPQQVFRLLFYSLLHFIGAAGFLLETGTVPLFRYMNLYIFTCFFTIYGYITSSQHDHLPVGLKVQLVEYCASIAEVVVSAPVQVSIFSGFYFTTA